MHGSSDTPGNEARQHKGAEAAGAPAESQLRHLTFSAADCSRIQPLLEAFHDRALGEVDDHLVREHVARCARCAAYMRRYEEIDAVLRVAAAPRVGQELRTRLYTRIAATQRRRSIFAVFGSEHQQETDEHASSSWRSGSRVFGGRSSGIVTNWVNGMAAIAVVLLLVLLFHTLMGMPSRRGMASTLTSGVRVIGTLSGLPKFSDYRAAYLDFDGHLRIGETSAQEIIGPTLPEAGLLMRTPAAPYYDVDVSQDGHYLAYVEGDASVRDAGTALPTGGPVAIVNLATGTIISAPVVTNDLSWSPDNRLLAAPDASNSAYINIIDATTGTVRQLTGLVAGIRALVPLVAGWIDSTHVAVFYQWGGSLPSPVLATPNASQSAEQVQQSLGSLDIRSGTITHLVDLPDPSDVFLSPDGEKVLLAPNYWTKTARVIDTRTGRSDSLDSIAQAFAGKFADLGPGGNWSMQSAWQPGRGHVLALSLANGSSVARQDANVWLLDLDNDSATQVAGNAYVLAWSPESPQALLLCDPPHADATGAYPMGGAGVGPTLYTISLAGSRATSPPLADSMAVFLGLVRTA